MAGRIGRSALLTPFPSPSCAREDNLPLPCLSHLERSSFPTAATLRKMGQEEQQADAAALEQKGGAVRWRAALAGKGAEAPARGTRRRWRRRWFRGGVCGDRGGVADEPGGSRGSRREHRHSKVVTSQELRDRRVRMSVPTAIVFYDIQDRLGVDQPSKAIEWLIRPAASAIHALPSLDCSFVLPPPAASPPVDDAEVSTSQTSKSSVLLRRRPMWGSEGCSSGIQGGEEDMTNSWRSGVSHPEQKKRKYLPIGKTVRDS